MNKKIRYSGIAAITFSLFMLSLGSMPTSDAGVVSSALTVTLTCGIQVGNGGSIDWDNDLNPNTGKTLTSTDIGDYTGAQPTDTNTVTNTASSNVRADVGDSNTGGYAGTTDTTTHIEPNAISIDLLVNTPPAGPVAMQNTGIPVGIGVLAPNELQTLQLVVATNNIVGTVPPITDLTWSAQINLIAVCEFV